MNKKKLIVILVSLLSLFNVFASTNILSINLGVSAALTGLEMYDHNEVSSIEGYLTLDLETYFKDGKSSKEQIVNNSRYINPKPFKRKSFSRGKGIKYNKVRNNNSKSSPIEEKRVCHGWYNGIEIKTSGSVGHVSYSTGYVTKQKIADNMDITEIIALQFGNGHTPNFAGFNLGLKFDVIYTYYFTGFIGLNVGLGLSVYVSDRPRILYEDNFLGIKMHF